MYFEKVFRGILVIHVYVKSGNLSTILELDEFDNGRI